MTVYIDPDLPNDPQAVLDEINAGLQTDIPDYVPRPAAPEQVMLRELVQIGVRTANVASRALEGIFRASGGLLGEQPRNPAAATCDSTWTIADTLGYTIAAATQVDLDGTLFLTTAEVTVDPGDDTATVALRAFEPGSAGNGKGVTAQLINTTPRVESIEADALSTGGDDGDTDAEYLARVAENRRRLRPAVTNLDDAISRALNTPGVVRATGRNRYWDSPLDTDSPLDIFLWVHGAGGANCSTDIKNAVLAACNIDREANYRFGVGDPTRTTIDVSAAFTVWPEYQIADAETAVSDALETYLDPAVFGSRPGEGQTAVWELETHCRRNNLIAVVENVPAVRDVTSLTLCVGGGSLATSDVALSGAAPLTEPGTITVTGS